MAANPKETTAIIRENAADHALRPLFMRFEWTRCISSPCEPYGSGELKTHNNVLQKKKMFLLKMFSFALYETEKTFLNMHSGLLNTVFKKCKDEWLTTSCLYA